MVMSVNACFRQQGRDKTTIAPDREDSMFERYTEKARRTIFFARCEASEFGSPQIEAEHLLLGLLHESEPLPERSQRADVSWALLVRHKELIRKGIKEHSMVRKPIPTSVDMPLSNECQRVLAYAAQEA
jgi:ATP-dependent Clp protease ATP-binding subunit ClpC